MGAGMMGWLLVFALGCLVSIVLMVLLRKMALRSRILMSKEIALVGGLGIGGSIVASLFLGIMIFRLDPSPIVPVMALSLTMLIFGVVDDIHEVSVLQKFLFQSVCAVLLIVVGVRTHIVYLGFWGNVILTFFWVLGVTNAFNLLDIIDGLCSGVALLAAGSFVVLSFLLAAPNMLLLSMALASAILGFWPFNFPPAKIYLGNSGSHFLGFVLATMTLMMSYTSSIERSVALVSPIIIFGLPLLDTAFLIYFRFKKGVLPFNKSNDHIALRLIDRGWTRKKALFFMLGLALLFSVCGIITAKADNVVGTSAVLFIVLVSSALLMALSKTEAHGR
jgi:UDP-GlcNAc:undecaprenyl-phosphate GlcNAc-1-phosphate transferase